jgi:DNA-binding NarL/FixJ family response regulator
MTLLAGKRILVVEDETIIALDIENALADAGAEVVGGANNVARALELAATPGLTAAIIDLRLQGESAASVVELLVARRVPFIFFSGQAERGAAAAWPAAPVISKPATHRVIIEALLALPA